MIRFVSRLMMIASIMQVTACTVLQKPTPEVVTSEIVYHDSMILTMESGQPLAQAILIQGDTITAVGNDAEVLAQAGPGARVYDMQGQTIVPGFIDTHNHRIAWSLVGGDYETPEAAIQAALEQGWTGLHELDVNNRLLDTLVTLDAQDQLRLRVAGYLAINSPVWDKSIGDQIFEYEPTIYSPNLRISGVKVFMKEGSQFFKDQRYQIPGISNKFSSIFISELFAAQSSLKWPRFISLIIILSSTHPNPNLSKKMIVSLSISRLASVCNLNFLSRQFHISLSTCNKLKFIIILSSVCFFIYFPLLMT